MKQLLVLSGKGGTGKTTIAAAFIKLSKAEVFADCDVDAPNLHLVIPQFVEPKQTTFFGLPKAIIDQTLCTACDLCRRNCRFGAITAEGNQYVVDPFACEGCSVCNAVCPSSAVSFATTPAGDLLLYESTTEVFSTAKLNMGSGASGKLVSEVKNQMKQSVLSAELVIIDGSPGIGCPVIASLSGVDMVLIVAEPSLSGISDMERIIKTAGHFGIKIMVCINKYDTHLENSEKIESFCRNQILSFVGKIPYDPEAVNAVNRRQTIVERDCASGNAVKKIFELVMATLFEDGK